MIDWLSDPEHSTLIRSLAALVGIPGGLWGAYLCGLWIRGKGLDRSIAQIVQENRDLRKLVEELMLAISALAKHLEFKPALEPATIEAIEAVALASAATEPQSQCAATLVEELTIARTERRSTIEDDIASLCGEMFAAKKVAHAAKIAAAAEIAARHRRREEIDAHDPLAELARLIGQTDPFADLIRPVPRFRRAA